MIWLIALRNLLKNSHRSIITITSIGIGGLAMMLFGGFITSIYFGVQTGLIQDQGQLQIYQQGYLKYGSADPDNYTINDYQAVITLLQSDPQLKRQISVITPQISLAGIAGITETGNSKTFIGRGIQPEEADKMRLWDGWNVKVSTPPTGLNRDQHDEAIVGVGMARQLGLCKQLNIVDCEDPPRLQAKVISEEQIDVSDLVSIEDKAQLNQQTDKRKGHQLNLLAASTEGAPNIMSVYVKQAQSQAQRSLDNAYVMVHFDLARELLYGDQPRSTVILVQIHDPNQAEQVKQHIQQILDTNNMSLEILHFNEVDPSFDRVFNMFSFIFGVVSLFLGIVIIFTITNTINLTVMERVNEIGTIRAMGFRRSFIMRMFLSESALMGLFGILASLAFTLIVSTIINNMNLSWTPPSNATPLTINLMILENPPLLLSIMGFLFTLSVFAAIWPTYKASRMNIISAIHHV
ncbi:ABC transporter permease [Neisseria sp. Ec49-e6-T10]|uniref:ABC transporter permease n=1 Tax=Neisseria sp. Ec49-e6-T10 TaxID=3140744 RepID=UPI003EC0AE79